MLPRKFPKRYGVVMAVAVLAMAGCGGDETPENHTDAGDVAPVADAADFPDASPQT